MKTSLTGDKPDVEAIAKEIAQKAKEHLTKQSTIDEINRRLSEQMDSIIERVQVQIGFDFEELEPPLLESVRNFAFPDAYPVSLEALQFRKPLSLKDLLHKLEQALVVSELIRFVEELESELSAIKHKQRIMQKYAYLILRISPPSQFVRSGLTSEQFMGLEKALKSEVRIYSPELRDRIEKTFPILREGLISQHFHEDLLHQVRKWLSTALPTAQKWEKAWNKEDRTQYLVPAGHIDITSNSFWWEYTGEREAKGFEGMGWKFPTYDDRLGAIVWRIIDEKTNLILSGLSPAEYALPADMFSLYRHDEEAFDYLFDSLCEELSDWIKSISVHELMQVSELQ